MQSGYRNRLLPLPLPTRQPNPHNSLSAPAPYVAEPIWTQLLPVSVTAQYILHWYIAETLPLALETELNTATDSAGGAYCVPPRFEEGMGLVERVGLDGVEGGKGVYEPVRHEGTGVDEEERMYSAELVGSGLEVSGWMLVEVGMRL